MRFAFQANAGASLENACLFADEPYTYSASFWKRTEMYTPYF